MAKIIHILAHNIEDFIAGDYHSFDHHSVRFMEKIRTFSGGHFPQELWTLSRKGFSGSIVHEKGFKIRIFPITLNLPLPLEISLPLLKEIARFKPEEKTIWHLHSYYLFMNDFIAPLLKLKKQKFLMHFHGGGPNFKKIKSAIYSAYHYLISLRLTLNLADAVIVLNRDEEERIKNFLWVKKKKILYFPSTVPFNSCSSSFLSAKKGIKMAIAGRMEKISDKKFVREILEKVLTQNPGASLETIGLVKKEPFLELLEKNFPGRVILSGWLDKKSLLKKFQQADIYLHLFQNNEGSPITLIEALSQGLPALAFDVEGVRDAVINNITGWLAKSQKEFEEKLGNIVRRPNQAFGIKNSCVSAVKENFLDEKYFPEIIEIYKKISK